MDNIYFEKGLDSMITEIEKYGNDLELGFINGFAQGCLMKDKEQEDTRNLINKVDTNMLISTLDNINLLVQFLKSNEDVYIKAKIIQEVGNLNNYITLKLNDNEGDVQ